MSEKGQKEDFVWRGECVRCRHIWFSKDRPKKCPKCGFIYGIMRDKLPISKELERRLKAKNEYK